MNVDRMHSIKVRIDAPLLGWYFASFACVAALVVIIIIQSVPPIQCSSCRRRRRGHSQDIRRSARFQFTHLAVRRKVRTTGESISDHILHIDLLGVFGVGTTLLNQSRMLVLVKANILLTRVSLHSNQSAIWISVDHILLRQTKAPLEFTTRPLGVHAFRNHSCDELLLRQLLFFKLLSETLRLVELLDQPGPLEHTDAARSGARTRDLFPLLMDDAELLVVLLRIFQKSGRRWASQLRIGLHASHVGEALAAALLSLHKHDKLFAKEIANSFTCGIGRRRLAISKVGRCPSLARLPSMQRLLVRLLLLLLLFFLPFLVLRLLLLLLGCSR